MWLSSSTSPYQEIQVLSFHSTKIFFTAVFTDGKNTESWAVNLKSGDYELLCPDGGRKPVDQYQSCNLAHAPPHMVT